MTSNYKQDLRITFNRRQFQILKFLKRIQVILISTSLEDVDMYFIIYCISVSNYLSWLTQIHKHFFKNHELAKAISLASCDCALLVVVPLPSPSVARYVHLPSLVSHIVLIQWLLLPLKKWNCKVHLLGNWSLGTLLASPLFAHQYTGFRRSTGIHIGVSHARTKITITVNRYSF